MYSLKCVCNVWRTILMINAKLTLPTSIIIKVKIIQRRLKDIRLLERSRVYEVLRLEKIKR
jgi:hypothetical protein